MIQLSPPHPPPMTQLLPLLPRLPTETLEPLQPRFTPVESKRIFCVIFLSFSHPNFSATWFTQNGNYGACGDLHSDSDFIAALDYRTYGDSGVKSPYCGQKIRVSWQGKSVDVTVADDCPSCSGPSSVDLSVAAFQALAPLDVGDLSGSKCA